MSWYIVVPDIYRKVREHTRLMVSTAIGYFAGNDNWTHRISEAPRRLNCTDKTSSIIIAWYDNGFCQKKNNIYSSRIRRRKSHKIHQNMSSFNQTTHTHHCGVTKIYLNKYFPFLVLYRILFICSQQLLK